MNIASSTLGKDMMTSVPRMSRLSVNPPLYALIDPTMMPINAAMPVTIVATRNAVRPPIMILVR